MCEKLSSIVRALKAVQLICWQPLSPLRRVETDLCRYLAAAVLTRVAWPVRLDFELLQLPLLVSNSVALYKRGAAVRRAQN